MEKEFKAGVHVLPLDEKADVLILRGNTQVEIQAEHEHDITVECYDHSILISHVTDPTVHIDGECFDESQMTVCNSDVIAHDLASVFASGSSNIKLNDHASADVRDYTSVTAYDNSFVKADGKAEVFAYGDASCEVTGEVTVYAHQNSYVESLSDDVVITAQDKAHVVAKGGLVTEALDNAKIELFNSAVAYTYTNVWVKAHDKSTVHANGESYVEVYDKSVDVIVDSEDATIEYKYKRS